MNEGTRVQRKRAPDAALDFTRQMRLGLRPSRASAAVEGITRSGAQELNAPDRAFFEARLGHDFSRVQVHADAQAAEAADELGALAYTVGSDVVFGEGQYAPGSGAGQGLLAHELTHVAQQGGGDAPPDPETLTFGEPGDAFEAAADSAAETVVGGEAAGAAVASSSAAPGAQLMTKTDRQEDDPIGTVLEGIANSLDLSKGLLEAGGEESIMAGVPGMGLGFEGLSEMAGRGAKGQGGWESFGGGLTTMLGSGIMGQGGSTEFNPAGVASSGLKMLGSMMGEKEGPDIGLKDAGEYLDVGAKSLNPEELAKQGVKEGLAGAYNTLQSTGDWLATGSTDKFLQQGESQLKGDTGPITQGYSMLANVAGSAVTGDWSEMDRIGRMAQKGELGALPKLGSKLGDVTYDVSEVAGAGFGMIGDVLTGNTANVKNRQDIMGAGNPLGRAVNEAGEFWGDAAWDATEALGLGSTVSRGLDAAGGAIDTIGNLPGQVAGGVSSAVDWAGHKANEAASGVSSAVDWAGNRAGEVVGGVSSAVDWAGNKAGEVAGGATAAVDWAGNKAGQAWDDLVDLF